MAARPKGDTNRQPLTTRIDAAMVKRLKFLSVELEKPLNDLFEEAIEDLLKKYQSKKK